MSNTDEGQASSEAGVSESPVDDLANDGGTVEPVAPDPDALEREIASIEERLDEVEPELLGPLEHVKAAVQLFKEERSRGPLPPPTFLRQYEEIYPGAAEILFEEFKRQGEHRRSIERQVVSNHEARADRGQWLASVIAFSTLVAAVICILAGQPWAGSGLFGAALVSIVTALLRSSSRQESVRRGKPRRAPTVSDRESLELHQDN